MIPKAQLVREIEALKKEIKELTKQLSLSETKRSSEDTKKWKGYFYTLVAAVNNNEKQIN